MTDNRRTHTTCATAATLAAAVLALLASGCAGREARNCTPVNHWGAPVFSCASDSAAEDTDAIAIDTEPEPEPEPEPEVIEPQAPPIAVLRGDRIEIMQKVQFDTGKATLLPASYELLDQVAQIMRDNPGIKLIRIEGHTDSRGKKKMNKRLSQRRAEAVRTYLIEHGVDGERMKARGFGQSKPIADNKTDEGRETNRRVEFNIIDNQR